jgi:hypothetical protein
VAQHRFGHPRPFVITFDTQKDGSIDAYLADVNRDGLWDVSWEDDNGDGIVARGEAHPCQRQAVVLAVRDCSGRQALPLPNASVGQPSEER